VADLLVEGKAVGWVRGRMEFRPRAVGNRSILGDPLADHAEGT
jgi:carbamoyltransferase